MYGAILGDIIGSPFEGGREDKTKNFKLFNPYSRFTDDSVMTIAVGEALLAAGEDAACDKIEELVIKSMRKWGRRFPRAGYGGYFKAWLRSDSPEPYGSFGNGSAMRVSAAGWLYSTLERTRAVARATAVVTHNHPEGIKGAEACASAIFLARTGSVKEEIKKYIEDEFGYDLDTTCDEIRPGYFHVSSCQGTVPQALRSFYEGESFEDVVRTAISLGGDTDTLAAMAGSVAEAYYGVPLALKKKACEYITEDMLKVLRDFESARKD